MAATDVDVVDDLDDDFDVVIQDLDLDLLVADDEFRGGARACYYSYSAIFSDADIVSHCRNHGRDGDGGAAPAGGWLLARLCEGGDGAGEGAGSSPAGSGVTDGPLAPAAAGDDDDDAEAVSAYVAELERFLLEDDDDAACGEQAEEGLLGVVDDYFGGDQLRLATAAEVVPRTEGEEEEENGDVLAAPEDEQSASRKRARYE